MNFFNNCFSEEQVKFRYRDLCKTHHPDLGGSEEMMKEVNLAYEDRLRQGYRKDYSNEEAESFVDLEREVAAKIAEIIGLRGIIVELVGRWVWVTGETFVNKKALALAGFWWASKKRAWYWHLAKDSCRGGKKTLEEIKAKYGSQVLHGVRTSQLAA